MIGRKEYCLKRKKEKVFKWLKLNLDGELEKSNLKSVVEEKEDYGILKVLSRLSKERVEAVMRSIEDKGVPNEIGLEDLRVEDLMEGNLLKKPAATNLIKHRKKGDFFGNFTRTYYSIFNTLNIKVVSTLKT